MAATIAVTTDDLSDIELTVLSIVAQTDQDPRGRKFNYDAVEHLFTENDGTRMHSETKIALAAVVEARLFNT